MARPFRTPVVTEWSRLVTFTSTSAATAAAFGFSIASSVDGFRVLPPSYRRRMVRTCPECGGDLTDLEPGAEMGSRPISDGAGVQTPRRVVGKILNSTDPDHLSVHGLPRFQ